MPDEFDLVVVGGGINGAGIARDAAGRGLRVLLCEQGDLAQATSSASTKLIHGGLRYLEYYEFRLVREALIERERLLGLAPHLIRPMTFVLPHAPHLRPAWLIRLGLFLYDHLGGRRRLPASGGLRFDGTGLGSALAPEFARGFHYADCAVDDTRLVVLNAVSAREHGAEILTRTRFVSARRDGALWRIELADPAGGAGRAVTARILVNAAGPWIAEVLGAAGRQTDKQVRLIKGSHIVVPRLFDGEHAYMLQNPDRRIVFAIPYEREYTLIGTTDVPCVGPPAAVSISAEETAYLCDSIGRYFRRQVTPRDIVWSYAGIRPLYDDAAQNASAVTRDYVLDLDRAAGTAPLLSVFGGKITTYRRLAEHALEKLAPFLPAAGKPWTATEPLPGGDIAQRDFDRFLAGLKLRYPFLPPNLAERLARAYGTRVLRILDLATSLADLGPDFGGGLHRAELDFLVSQEWARTAEDVLWRRSKLGLHVPPGAEAKIAAYLAGPAIRAAMPVEEGSV
jgi:glycerol-3-phosphate dehydrogenase